MQSPCLKEVSQVVFDGCCPNPLLGFPEPLNKTTTTKTKTKTKQSTAAICRRDFAATTTCSIFPNAQFTNPDSIPSLQDSFTEFIKAYPQYVESYEFDQIRAKEYNHLSLSNRTCLDYIGIGLFSYSQTNQIVTPSSSSSSPPEASDFPVFAVSYKSGNLKTQLLHGGHGCGLESAMKKRIMGFLNMPESDYSMVFTANRTSAFKLLAEAYPFQSSKKLLTVYDYESEAVQAMLNSSERKGAQIMSAEFSWPRLRINSTKLKKMIWRKRKKKSKRGLFVFPLHSRMTGARYPYLWMNVAQENEWHTLVDACALGPKDMDSFALSLIRPDFLICSFYKIFGENPSGFGCLLVKRSTIHLLEDSTSTTGAGMVSLIPSDNLFSSFQPHPPASNSFSGPLSGNAEQEQTSVLQSDDASQEDTSTILESGISEIECRALDQVDLLGLTKVSNRARCLINWLVSAFMKLKHPNTQHVPLVTIYGPKVKFDRGPALAFNVYDWKGEKVEVTLVQKLADRSNISLSYGFLNHISFSDKYREQKQIFLERRTDAAKEAVTRKGKEEGDVGITVVTVALSFLTNFADVYRLWKFISQFLDADFVEKAKWRYTALNQTTIDV